MNTQIKNRQVLVDDTDGSIEYFSTGWVEEKGTRLDISDYGLPFNGTLHSTSSNTNFTVKFSGSSVSVYASIDVQFINGIQDPQWDCLVDTLFPLQKPILFTSKRDLKAKNFELCTGSAGIAGPHELVVAIHTNRSSSLAFDYLLYSPAPDADLSNKVVRIDNTDEAIKILTEDILLSPLYVNDTLLAYSNGSSLSFEFVGNSLAWYGCTPIYPEWIGREPSSAVYSIDGQANQTFILEGATKNLTNQILFTTPDLSYGKHKLAAIYLGDGRKQIPLCLDYFIVTRNGTAEAAGISNTVSSTEPLSSPSSSPEVFIPGKKEAIGPIIGGVVGGLVVALSAIICFLWFFKKRHVSKMEVDLLSDIDDEDSSPTPQVTPFFYDTKDKASDIMDSELGGRDLPSAPAISQDRPSDTHIVQPISLGLNHEESASPRPPRLVRHRDSGFRISTPLEDEIIEVPPTYTPS